MKNPRHLLTIYQSRTGKTTHRPTPETKRDELAQWFIPKVPEEWR